MRSLASALQKSKALAPYLEHVYVHLDGKIEALGRSVPRLSKKDRAAVKAKAQSPFSTPRSQSAQSARSTPRKTQRGGSAHVKSLAKEIAQAARERPTTAQLRADVVALTDELSREVVSLAVIDVRDNFETQTEEAMAEARKTKGALASTVQRLSALAGTGGGSEEPAGAQALLGPSGRGSVPKSVSSQKHKKARKKRHSENSLPALPPSR